jgi:hypothetical protein
VIGQSDTASDLDNLKKLKITNFRYIDVIGKGNQTKKGVIAQEVEEIYPDAVRITSGFIPNVYVLAGEVHYNASTQELTVTVPKPHGFVVGDMVRIITDKGNVEKPVAAVTNDKTFVLSGVQKSTRTAFVYGKKVDDFREVDYDQLFSMNISATQQLATDNEELSKANAELKAESEALEKRIAALEQEFEALQKQK